MHTHAHASMHVACAHTHTHIHTLARFMLFQYKEGPFISVSSEPHAVRKGRGVLCVICMPFAARLHLLVTRTKKAEFDIKARVPKKPRSLACQTSDRPIVVSPWRATRQKFVSSAIANPCWSWPSTLHWRHQIPRHLISFRVKRIVSRHNKAAGRTNTTPHTDLNNDPPTWQILYFHCFFDPYLSPPSSPSLSFEGGRMGGLRRHARTAVALKTAEIPAAFITNQYHPLQSITCLSQRGT